MVSASQKGRRQDAADFTVKDRGARSLVRRQAIGPVQLDRTALQTLCYPDEHGTLLEHGMEHGPMA